MVAQGRKKFYSSTPESVQSEIDNFKRGGNFYLDLPEHIKLWSPKEGDNFIRILPSCDPNFQIWFHVWFHYNTQSKSYWLCPKNMSPKNTVLKPCPVCEEFARLEQAAEQEDVLRHYKAQSKTLFFIIPIFFLKFFWSGTYEKEFNTWIFF